MHAAAATGDPAVDALIDKLVEQRVITRDDAKELKKPVASLQGEQEGRALRQGAVLARI